MPLHAQPQLFLFLFGLGNIGQDRIDILCTIRLCQKLAFVQNPKNAAVFGLNAVLRFKDIFSAELSVDIFQQGCPVLRADQLYIMILDMRCQLCPAVTQQGHEAVVDI